jgi:hypothetical protein
MSQASYNVPTGGSFSMVTFSGLMNGAYNALATQSAGASMPANGPGNAAQEFQTWFNTTNVNFPVLNYFDGVNWDKTGTLDVANSNWLPKMGGGMVTLASGATVNIGASPQTFITISGTTGPITSLGAAATIGEERKLQFTGTQTLVYNASAIITPGLANIVTQSGDSCTAVYQGASTWIIFGYVRGINLPGFTLPTGAVFWMPANTTINGAVRANALTLGSAASGATELASATAFNLYVYLWLTLTDSVCPVTGGRGGSAQADFNANKAIGLPDLRGRVLAGLDDMGNSAASRLTSLTISPNGVTPMGTGGGQVVTMVQANLPSVNWAITEPNSGTGHNHSYTGVQTFGTSNAGATNNYDFNTTGFTTGNSVTGITVASGGSSTAMITVQPTALGAFYLCL